MNVYSAGCKVKCIAPAIDGGVVVGAIYTVVGQENHLLYLEHIGTYNIGLFQPYEGTYKKNGITTTVVPLGEPRATVESTGFKDPRPYQTTLTISNEEVTI